MPTENATYISELTPGSPTGQSPRAEGDDELRQLKTVLQSQFSNLGVLAVTATAQQLNALADYETGEGSVETRFDLLEDQVFTHELPIAAYDFKNSWWQQGSDTEPKRVWYAVGRADSFSNVPWPWGSNIGPGEHGDTYTVLITRLRSGTGVSLDEITFLNAGNLLTYQYWRAAPTAATITSALWNGYEYTTIDTAEGTSGSRINSSVCGTVAELCP